MARFIRRIGTKAFKFQAEAFIEKVEVNIKFPCQISILWKRGNHKNETRKVDMDTSTGTATFMEKLTLLSTLYYDTNKKKYQEKKCSFTVLIHTAKGTKVAGAAEFNLSALPNGDIKKKREELALKKCPDPNAKLSVELELQLLSEVQENESVNSGVTEQDSFGDEDYMEKTEESNRSTTRDNDPSNINNMLSSIATRNQLQRGVEQAAFRQQPGHENKNTGLEVINSEGESSETYSSPVQKTEKLRKLGSNENNMMESTESSRSNKENSEITSSRLVASNRSETAGQGPLAMKIKSQLESSAPKEKLTFNKLFENKPIKPTPKFISETKVIKQQSQEVIEEPKQEALTFRPRENISPQRSQVPSQSEVNTGSTMSVQQMKELEESKRMIKAMQAKLEQYENQGSSKDKEIERLRYELTQKVKVLESLKQENETLLAEKRSISSEMSNSPTMNAQQMRELEESKRMVKLMQAKLDQYEKDGESREKELERVRYELNLKTAENAKMKTLLENLRQENESLQAEKRSAKGPSSDEVVLLRMTLTEKDDEISGLNRRIEELQKEIEPLKQNLDKLKKDKANDAQLYYTTIEKAKAEIANRDTHIMNLTNQTKAQQKELEDLRQTVNKLTQEKSEDNRNLIMAIENYKTDLKDLQDRNAELEKSNAEMHKEIISLESQLNNLQIENNNIKKEHAATTSQFEALKHETGQLIASSQAFGQELQRYREKSKKLEEELEKQRSQMAAIETEKTKLQNSLTEKSTEFEIKTKEFEEERARLQERLKEIDNAHKEYVKASEAQIAELKKRAKEVELGKEDSLAKQNQMALELQALKASYEKLAAEKDSYTEGQEAKIRELEKALELAKGEASVYKEKNAELLQVEEKLRMRESELSDQIEELKRQTKETLEKNQSLVRDVDLLNERVRQLEQENVLFNTKAKSELSSFKANYESDLELANKKIQLRDERITELEGVKQSYESQIQQLSKNIATRDQKIGELEDSNIRYENQLKEIAKSMSQKDQKITELDGQNVALIEENEELRNKIADLEQKIKEGNPELESELNDLRKKLKETERNYESKLDELRDEVERLKTDLAVAKMASAGAKTLEDHLASASIENEELRKQVNELKAKQKSLEANHEETLANMKKETDKLKQEIDRLTQELTAAQKQGSNNQVLEEKIANLITKIEAFEKQESQLKERIQELEDTLQEKIADISSLNEENKRLREEVNTGARYKAGNDELEEQLAALSLENENLKKHVNELKAKQKSLEASNEEKLANNKKEAEKLKQEIDRLKEELSEAQKQNSDNQVSESEIAGLKLEIDTQKKQEAKLRKQIQELEDTVQEKNADIASLNEENERLREKANSSPKIGTGNDELEEQLAALSLENETLKKQIKDLKANSAPTSKLSSVNQITKENEELKKSIKELQAKLKKVQEELDQTNEQFEKMVKEKENFNATLRKEKDKLLKVQDTLSVMEAELVKSKQTLGEVMNVAMENGGTELIEKIYAAMNLAAH